MGYIEFVKTLPDSIFNESAASNNYKLFSLFTSELDYLDIIINDLMLIFDYQNQQGIILDLIGKITTIKRQGRSDSNYIKYIFIGLLKYRSTGSINDLNNVCYLILGEQFLYIRELFENDETKMISSDFTWLNGSYYLTGDIYLGSNIFQPAYFEIVIQAGCSESLKTIITETIKLAKGAAIKFRIREE